MKGGIRRGMKASFMCFMLFLLLLLSDEKIQFQVFCLEVTKQSISTERMKWFIKRPSIYNCKVRTNITIIEENLNHKNRMLQIKYHI